jgi:large subunit ribosomal protein L19e
MNLARKKNLAVRALGVGKKRIVFLEPRKDEIKEAITKQDIRDLKEDGAIIIKDVKGRKKTVKRKRRRGVGKIEKRVNVRKKNYVIMTRKLRKYVSGLLSSGQVNKEEAVDMNKKIRNKFFRSKAHLKEYVGGLKK